MDEPDDRFRLVLKNGRREGILFKVRDIANGDGNIRVSFVDDSERKRLLPVLHKVLQKSVACVGCRLRIFTLLFCRIVYFVYLHHQHAVAIGHLLHLDVRACRSHLSVWYQRAKAHLLETSP
jgi:hypothetical protein